MGDSIVTRYWRYICSQMANPTMEPEIKCPICESRFVEEMTITRHSINTTNGTHSGSVNTLWAPILLGLIGGLGSSELRRRGTNDSNNSQDAMYDELGREFESLIRKRRRRRRRISASVIWMLQYMHTAVASESENSASGIRMLQEMQSAVASGSENPETGNASSASGMRMLQDMQSPAASESENSDNGRMIGSIR